MHEQRDAERPNELGREYARMAEFALARHTARLAEHPRHAAASYLRAAVTAVRELALLSRLDPRLLSTAQDVLVRVTVAARDAEEICFAAGGNSAPYLSLLVMLESWRIRLLFLLVRHEQQQEASATPASTKAPAGAMAAREVPRRFVAADQGRRRGG